MSALDLLLLRAFQDVRYFLEQGGVVLQVILIVTFILWVLIVERLIFFGVHYSSVRKKAELLWESLPIHHRHEKSRAQLRRDQWIANRSRDRIVSVVGLQLHRNIALIKVLVLICPLLGLLGTVTGMLDIFAAISAHGHGSARAMATGISKATLPTMAGMATGIVGVIAITLLSRFAVREKLKLYDHLTI